MTSEPPAHDSGDDSPAVQWHFACNLSQLENSGCEVLVDQHVIALFKTELGIFAVDGMCAHQGGPLAKGRVDGTCVTCPWHGWQYNVTNGNNLLSGRKMLTTFETAQRDSEIWVAIPVASQG